MGRTVHRDPVTGSWDPPRRAPLDGPRVRVEPLDPARHAASLHAASHETDEARRLWEFLPYGPFPAREDFSGWLEGCAAVDDPIFYAIRSLAEDRPLGMASYLRITPEHGVIEIGHIWFSPRLQGTVEATESLFLMMRHAMDDLGYRRLEWKCNALNEASRRAAVRLGFTFEGVFHHHLVVKGRNRDSAWYSLLDHEWPAVRTGFERWLEPSNFDGEGRQRASLEQCRASSRDQIS